MRLRGEVVAAAHNNSGHSNWETVWEGLKQRYFFPSMAIACSEYVRQCKLCNEASPVNNATPPATRQDVPSRPWEVVQIDTLELGVHRGRPHRYVLVCVDMFTRWVVVFPLRNHDPNSVAHALIGICSRFGSPSVVRCDNSSEFRNHLLESLFEVFGVAVQHGVVRHLQSQGCAERFNRTLLTMIRNTVNSNSNELEVLLFYYWTRPHGLLKVSPMAAMFCWQSSHMIVDKFESEDRYDLASWVVKIRDRAANIHGYVTQQLAQCDGDVLEEVCPYEAGEAVLFRRPPRHQKGLAQFESGLQADSIISPTTVVIRNDNGRTKTINIELTKRDVAMDQVSKPDAAATDTGVPENAPVPLLSVEDDGGYGLRIRATIASPTRFQ